METKNIISTDDPFYRYKRPVIEVRSDKSNKTYLLNINDVGAALSRPPELIIKFLQYTFNTQSNVNEGWLKGRYLANQIDALIDIFVNQLVLCHRCNNPETTLHLKVRKELIYLKCLSCGAKSVVQVAPKLKKHMLKMQKNK